ncbi:GntR family transcriptional regulator [Actinocrispum wychmicini]|uniref:TetR family transcriptional regulator n=1 Tax=Actinocrispum wychmicini TaxID=1213861 RepID=A0A4R2JPJ3_9PSEU|nr:GntR family transcriptional regulator [Actinocrispum wychmicini]TCO62091.1 TetR family transcriptional regulator [Actinocrispum wychmicini]
MATQAPPPYQRIVAEIRRRITTGELPAGARVPSTRQIAKEWNVALATAAKALTALSQAGLVRAQPRVGTVVAGRRPPAEPDSTDTGEFTRDRIVRAAIDIADEHGLAALSMRGVAAKLGVATMSPYRYVNGKEALIELMADAAFGDESYPEQPPDGWRARLELGLRMLWRLFRKHPWLAQFNPLTRPLPLANQLAHAEWAMKAMDGHGLDPTTMMNLHVLGYSYVHGIAVNLEREAHAEATTGLSDEQWMDTQASALAAIVESGAAPTFAKTVRALDDGYDLRLDDLFEFGLQPLLDGFAVIIEGGH